MSLAGIFEFNYMTPLVTILVPTFNRAHFLRETILSALAQTYSSFEVIVLDDASPDDTPTLMKEFGPK